MRQIVGRTFLGGLTSLLLLLAACTAPVDTKGPVTLRQGLTLQWQVNTARSIYPASYPTPATYDLLLHSAGQTDVVVTGISTTSWTLENLARVVWTVTVTGKDGAGKAIVQGGTSVDLSVSATQTSTVTLQYLTQGTGSGSIHLTLDLSEAPTTPDTVTLALTDPVGVTTHPAISLNGTTASFTLDPAPVGAYNVYFFVEAGPKSAGKFETVMVFQNVDTAATLKFLGGDFSTTFHPVTGVSLDSSALQLYTNNVSSTLTATVAPANATNPSVAWTSSDPGVATVSQAGLVVPKAVGTTTIKVTTGEGSFEATCEVTVSEKHVVGVSVSPVNLILVQEGATAQLTATVNPSDASDTSYTWSSSDTSVATVNASGVVTPVVAGSATITATSTDGAKKGTSAVTVLPNGASSGNVSILTPIGAPIEVSGPAEHIVGLSDSVFSATSPVSLEGIVWLIDGKKISGASSMTLHLGPSTVAPGAHILSILGRDPQGLSVSVSISFNATCHIIFDANGGSGTMPDQVLAPGTVGELSAISVARPGYTFSGWNTASDGSGTLYSNRATILMGSSSILLFARWESQIIVVGSGATTMIVRPDGTLWATGSNNTGAFGDGTTVGTNIPKQVMTGVLSVSEGMGFSMIIKSDGTLWGCGENDDGQLGDGTYDWSDSNLANKTTPVQVMSDVASVSAGAIHSMIVKNDGTLWATGWGPFGELGIGSPQIARNPELVMSDVASVSSGAYTTMILKTDGTLWATGLNSQGQLGDGTTTDRDIPVQIMTGVQAVDTDGESTMILKTDHTLWATGSNIFGQLGDGTNTSRKTPIQIMSDVHSVSTGAHTMILKQDGTLWATGYNDLGQLGDGNSDIEITNRANRNIPIQVLSNISAVWTAGWGTIILKVDGSLWAVGDNQNFSLGLGSTNWTSTITRVEGF